MRQLCCINWMGPEHYHAVLLRERWRKVEEEMEARTGVMQPRVPPEAGRDKEQISSKSLPGKCSPPDTIISAQ